MRICIRSAAFLLFILCTLSGVAQSHSHSHLCDESCGLIALNENNFTFVPPPADYVAWEDRTVVISVNYTGFTAEAQTAFQYAVDIWASVLSSNVPIVINANFTSLSGGTLGFASAEDFRRNFAGAPLTDTWYPIALANKLAGSDLANGFVDIDCSFNSNFTWYYGTDGNCPGGQYDFVTVVLHELCHGLGFLGFGTVSGNLGSLEQLGSPAIYDRFTEDLGGTDLTSMPENSTTLGSALTGNNVYWFGAQGMALNGGTRPRLYAPTTWNSGSSYSHLNENTYPSGNINSLMTPFLGAAEAIHDPGPIVEGMFVDMGWTFNSCEISDVVIGLQSPCNPATNQYTQEVIVTYSDPPSTGSLSINGVIFPITTSPQTCVLSLASNGLTPDCTVNFTASEACAFEIPDAWQAPTPCCDNIRITAVNETSNQITLKNFGSCTQSVSSFQLSSSGTTINVSAAVLISGSLNLASNQSCVVQWNAFPASSAAGNLSLHEPGSSIVDVSKILDFMQWGQSGQGTETTAVLAGKWTAGTFITDISPFTFIGTGNQHGAQYWDGVTPPCAITSIIAGAQTPCDPNTDTYTQEVVVQFVSQPSTGNLMVNGQAFSIGTSPRSVILTGLISDSQPVDVTAMFSANAGCNLTSPDVFISPAACACFTDITGDGTTNIQDFLLLLADYGCVGICAADINGDGITGTTDLLILNTAFGTACP